MKWQGGWGGEKENNLSFLRLEELRDQTTRVNVIADKEEEPLGNRAIDSPIGLCKSFSGG
jgi:hypothetical protein